jgi:hypothetical protein
MTAEYRGQFDTTNSYAPPICLIKIVSFELRKYSRKSVEHYQLSHLSELSGRVSSLNYSVLFDISFISVQTYQ